MADTEIEANGTEPVVGDVVMSFRVLERCGAGAYGVGLLCEDLRLPKRRVLVKWGRRADDDMRERFKQQARYELKIVSEYVRKTHEYDEVGPEHRPILVHEFIEGVPLDKWIANKSIGQRLERFAHIVRAMVDLKRVGFPHGDLHTGNVLVSGDRTILFDLSPESFGATYNAAGLRARAQHDDRCLETMFDEMFGEADMKALNRIALRRSQIGALRQRGTPTPLPPSFGGGRAGFERSTDRVKHGREVGDDVVVGEAQCAHAERGKPCIALGVGASALGMDRAIELDGDTAARCEEVEHEARSCVLPSELGAELASP